MISTTFCDTTKASFIQDITVCFTGLQTKRICAQANPVLMKETSPTHVNCHSYPFSIHKIYSMCHKCGLLFSGKEQVTVNRACRSKWSYCWAEMLKKISDKVTKFIAEVEMMLWSNKTICSSHKPRTAYSYKEARSQNQLLKWSCRGRPYDQTYAGWAFSSYWLLWGLLVDINHAAYSIQQTHCRDMQFHSGAVAVAVLQRLPFWRVTRCASLTQDPGTSIYVVKERPAVGLSSTSGG